jgi:outer membrane phospholipase A
VGQALQLGCALKNIYLNLNYFTLAIKRRKIMSEKTESKRIGAKQHKNSGRNTQKGDATWRDFVVDFKESSKSFTINQDVWAKAVTDSIKAGKDKSPAIVVILGEGNKKTRLAIIEFDLLDQLTWEANNGNATE